MLFTICKYFNSIIFAFLYFFRSYKLHRQCQWILCQSQIHFVKAYSITTYSWGSIPTGQGIPLKMLLARHPILCLILCTCVKTYFQPWCLPLIPLEISFEYHVLHSHGRKTSLSTTCPKSWEGPYIYAITEDTSSRLSACYVNSWFIAHDEEFRGYIFD